MGTRKLSEKPDEMLRGNLRWTSIPSRRSSNIPSRFMLGRLARVQTYFKMNTVCIFNRAEYLFSYLYYVH